MLPETPRSPSPSSSTSLASALKPDPPLPAGAPTLSWLPAARAWWTCPSGAEETGKTGRLMERGGAERVNRLRMKAARSLEISKSQTPGRITRGNLWVWDILPGGGTTYNLKLRNSLPQQLKINQFLFIVYKNFQSEFGT